MTSVTIQELHGTTDLIVRRASESAAPICVTDNGRPVAFLTSTGSMPVAFNRRPKRVLTPAFAALMREPYRGSLANDLDAIRGET